MQNSSTPKIDTEYIPRDDESEAERLVKDTGVGEPLYLTDEDVRLSHSMGEFGFTSELTYGDSK